MAYQKHCNHDGKFTRTIHKVYIEKDNIMNFYKSTKNMVTLYTMHNVALSGLISNSELQIVNKLPIIHQSCRKVATNNILKADKT